MKKVKNVLWAIGCIVVFGLVILAFVMPVDDDNNPSDPKAVSEQVNEDQKVIPSPEFTSSELVAMYDNVSSKKTQFASKSYSDDTSRGPWL